MRRPMAAVKAFIERKDQFLALELKVGDRTLWTLPGGRVEYGEAPREALEREIQEEVSLEAEITEPVGMYHFFIGPENNGEQVVLTVFGTDGFSGDVDIGSNPADENITGYEWVTPEEFLDRDSNESLKELVRTQYRDG
ncbi:MAG: NUDIX hydrolase [Candidatus Nanohaloarchaea archaeon]